MQRKKKIVVLILFGLLLVLLWLAFRRLNEQSVKASAPPPAQSQTSGTPTPPPHAVPGTSRDDTKAPAPAIQQRFIALFRTPISFYGKVIDQHGEPVSQAEVEFKAYTDPLRGDVTTYARKTDNNGVFSLTGIVGAGLAVYVSKVGYRTIPQADNVITSSALFEYAIPSDNGPSIPTQDNPAVFTLYKYGQLEPLVKVGEKNFRIARNGLQLTVSLDPNGGAQ